MATVDLKYKCQPHDGTPGEAMLLAGQCFTKKLSIQRINQYRRASTTVSRRINQYRSASTSILAHGDMGSNSLCMNDLVPWFLWAVAAASDDVPPPPMF